MITMPDPKNMGIAVDIASQSLFISRIQLALGLLALPVLTQPFIFYLVPHFRHYDAM